MNGALWFALFRRIFMDVAYAVFIAVSATVSITLWFLRKHVIKEDVATAVYTPLEIIPPPSDDEHLARRSNGKRSRHFTLKSGTLARLPAQECRETYDTNNNWQNYTTTLEDDEPKRRRLLVAFLHPEQWNGGGDRVAMSLMRYFDKKGDKLIWLTTMIDPHWKQQLSVGSKNLELRQRSRIPLHPGDWLSQNAMLAIQLALSGDRPDLIIADCSASCLPILRLAFPTSKLLFYCHFPHQLFTPTWHPMYRLYSYAVSLFEEHMFGYADKILVNSDFTARTFLRFMPGIAADKLKVVYPPCDVDTLAMKRANKTKDDSFEDQCANYQLPVSRSLRPANPTYTFLSVNRFWPEKRLDTIIQATAIVKEEGYFPVVKLAGSIMEQLFESQIYYDQLNIMAEQLRVNDLIQFIPSPTDRQKYDLYQQCDTVLYSPHNEHFGLVPIEALEQRRPVVVVNSGGPSETVIEGITGTKIDAPCPFLLAEAMIKHMKTKSWPHLDSDALYSVQQDRFATQFSTQGFYKQLDQTIHQLLLPLTS